MRVKGEKKGARRGVLGTINGTKIRVIEGGKSQALRH